ncbi:unnamed protein product, partial [Rotaria sp. Silwood1]
MEEYFHTLPCGCGCGQQQTTTTHF